MRARLHLAALIVAALLLIGGFVALQYVRLRPFLPKETQTPEAVADRPEQPPERDRPFDPSRPAHREDAARQTPPEALASLARRTRPRIPPLEEIFRPAENWEVAHADLDLERTLDLLASGRLDPAQTARYANALRQLAAAGDLDIATELARMLAAGIVEPEDPAEALRHALAAAEAGDPAAAMIVAQALEQGLGTAPDPQLARDWYTYAGEQGEADAWAELGFLDSLGVGSAIDHARAFDLYAHAYDRGSALGARRIGLAYLEGWGVEKDPTLAREWLETAGVMGDGAAYLQLRLLELKGMFGPPNAEIANAYLIAAAKNGDRAALLNWANQRMYQGGDEAAAGVADVVKLAREGTPNALFALAGATLADETRPEHDRLEDTVALLKMAADLKHPEAALRLAWCKAIWGDELPELASTETWLKRAAEIDGLHYQTDLMLSGLEQGLTPREVFRRYADLNDEDAYVAYSKISAAAKGAALGIDGVTAEVLRPRPVATPLPNYPPGLQAEAVGGEVRLVFVVWKDGTVRDIEVVRSSHPAFSQAAIDAVAQWKFKPGEKDGKPVNTQVAIDIPFNVLE